MVSLTDFGMGVLKGVTDIFDAGRRVERDGMAAEIAKLDIDKCKAKDLKRLVVESRRKENEANELALRYKNDNDGLHEANKRGFLLLVALGLCLCILGFFTLMNSHNMKTLGAAYCRERGFTEYKVYVLGSDAVTCANNTETVKLEETFKLAEGT